MKQNKIILLVIILLLIVGGFIFSRKPLFVQNTIVSSPSPQIETIPADWKRYENKEYGFSLAYPPEWVLASPIPTMRYQHILSLQDHQTAEQNEIQSNETVAVFIGVPEKTNKSLEDFVESEWHLQGVGEDKPDFGMPGPSLGGERTIQITTCGSYCFSTLYAKRNDMVYSLVLFTAQEGALGFETYETQKLQMIKSWKFISAASASNHKSFTEDEAIALVKEKYPEVKDIFKSEADIGKSLDITSKYDDNGWRLVFWKGAGDCQSHCLSEHFWYFMISPTGKVTQVGEYQRGDVSTESNPNGRTGTKLPDFLN